MPGFSFAAVVVFSLVGLASLAVPGDERDRICRPGFSASIRPSVEATAAIKRSMLRAAGISLSRLHDYELDAIVPLCLDGSPLDLNNLQLQLWPVARVKDQREAAACRAYCDGETTLEQARGMFTRDRR